MNFCITGESRIMNVPSLISDYTEITVEKSRKKMWSARSPYRLYEQGISLVVSDPEWRN
jgi:hypothetical protein